MTTPKTDDLTPSAKDPAEGGRDGAQGAEPKTAPQQSHLGAAGDPAEGGDPEGD